MAAGKVVQVAYRGGLAEPPHPLPIGEQAARGKAYRQLAAGQFVPRPPKVAKNVGGEQAKAPPPVAFDPHPDVIQGVVITFVDITVAKELESRLRKA